MANAQRQNPHDPPRAALWGTCPQATQAPHNHLRCQCPPCVRSERRGALSSLYFQCVLTGAWGTVASIRVTGPIPDALLDPRVFHGGTPLVIPYRTPADRTRALRRVARERRRGR